MPRTALMCSAAAMLMLSIPATAQVQGSEAQTSQLGQIEDQVTQSFDAKDELATSEIPGPLDAHEGDQLAQTMPPAAADQPSTYGIQGELEVEEGQLSQSSPPAADAESAVALDSGVQGEPDAHEDQHEATPSAATGIDEQ